MTTTTSLPAVVESGTVMLAVVVPGLLLAALTNEMAARAGPERSADAAIAVTTADGVQFIPSSCPWRQHATFGRPEAGLARTGAVSGEARVMDSGRQGCTCKMPVSDLIPLLLN